ncbi:MAG: hypothetical protein FJZ00_12360 [Candidatus Sericytochromatia bacterium]|uniref:Cytochrome c domain-containing protein n=1 Tax=Candidatus Tanganyikabacteria bacterium TaxID=2961651 RepID=A0A937X880_9BACT|nr:hypothetical protein [Candidatus Tanganyikabacteria bacterium]
MRHHGASASRRLPLSIALDAGKVPALAGSLLAVALAASGCIIDTQQAPGTAATAAATSSPAPTASPSPTAPTTVTEQPLILLVTAASTAAMTVEVRDADFRAVRTDLWFYKVSGSTYSALSGVSAAEFERRTPNFFLPSEVLGKPTGYEPADDGMSRNGVMTDSADRESADGRVIVKLPAGLKSGDKILVAAALEDQRYYGAKVFELPSGQPSDAPAFNDPRTYKRLTFADVKTIIEANCAGCHSPGGKIARIPMTTWSELVEKSFGGESGIGFEILVEPGAPALSGLTRRARPGLGRTGKLWYGKGGYRWAFDSTGNIASDRRMPPEKTDGQEPESDGPRAYFDTHLDDFKTLYNWVAQGAPEK